MVKMSEDFIKHAIDKAAQNLGYVCLSERTEVLNGHDVFAVLPTGFGKSFTRTYHR